jgi:hypothetical protein
VATSFVRSTHEQDYWSSRGTETTSIMATENKRSATLPAACEAPKEKKKGQEKKKGD